MATPITFDGQVAVVTGAGNGLGRGYALELAARGASVVCNDIADDAARATTEEIVGRGGVAVAESSSVATPEGGAAIVQAALDAFGSVEVVVNNAGQLRNAPFEDVTTDDLHAVIGTHLAGAFHVTQPAYRHMQQGGYGRILLTSSSAGMFGSPWQSSYAAVKAGVVGLCRALALEGEPHGIRVNTVMPMALTGIGGDGPPPFAPDHLRETMRVLAPLAPHMTVDNVVPFVVFLASRACDLTGEVFSVGCGHVSRVFVGATPGWYAPGIDGMTAEDGAANLDSVCVLDGFDVPVSMNDEAASIARRIAKAPE